MVFQATLFNIKNNFPKDGLIFGTEGNTITKPIQKNTIKRGQSMNSKYPLKDFGFNSQLKH